MSNISETNQIKLEEKHYIEAYKDKSELPKTIRLEASSICQLSCPSCPVRRNMDEFKNTCGLGFLSFDNFKKIVDDNPYITNIELSNNGEIFLNPELLKIIEYAYSKNIALTAFNGVNLNTLSDEVAEALVKYRFSHINISIDGASQDSYVKYRVNGNYNQVIMNLKKILYYKQKYNSAYPSLTWKYILFGHNEHEIIDAKVAARVLGIPIYFVLNYDQDFSPVKNIQFIYKQTGVFCGKDPNENFLNHYRNNPSNWFFCKELWSMPQINWDGRILGCCWNYKDDFGGNVFEDGLLNALNNVKMIYAKNMLTGNAPIIEGLPCSNCWCFEKMQSENFYMKSHKLG